MAGFEIKDRRGLAARDSGVIIARGAADVRRAVTGQDVADALARGRQGPSPTDWAEATKMRLSRMSRRRTAAMSGGGDVSFATPRPRDPMWYWRDSMLPYEVSSPEELVRLREWCRFIYRSDSTLGSVIDIYSRYPVLGLELRCKDGKLVDFYSSLLLDQLNYEEFLIDIGREYWCALPGEMVTTASGVEAIEALQVGTQVMTHRGRLESVITSSSRMLDTSVYEVRPYYGLPLRFTEGHKFFTRRSGRVGWSAVESITSHDEVFVPVDKTIEDRVSVDLWESLDRSNWQVHGPLIQDVDATPRQRKSAREKHRKLSRLGIPEGAILRRKAAHAGRWSILNQPSYALDPDLMRLLGLFVAEGCATDDGAQWSYGSHEISLAEETRDLVKRIFGLESVIQERSSTKVVITYNKPLAAWLGSLFGSGAKDKSLPEWMLRLPASRLAPLVGGWLDGDGHVARVDGSQGRRWARVVTGSRVLAHQMGRIVRRMGFVSTTYEHRSTRNGTPCVWWTVGPVMGSTKAFLRVLGWTESRIEAIGAVSDSEPRYANWCDDGYWVRVRSTKVTPYHGVVHDIGVSADHSFVASDVAVHNCVGEAWPLGSFNELLGVWEADELINPDDVFVERSPFLRDPRYSIRLPETLRNVLRSGQPAWEYTKLMQSYPELRYYTGEDARMPVSSILLQQYRFKGDTFNPRGIPILTRALRPAIQEEMLNAAQDAISDRLYTPLVLARLGASAQDLGTEKPWVPTQDDLDAFESNLDAALAADFRVLTTHFAVQMDTVFGRETMPNLDADFDRLTDKKLQAFGLSKTALTGAGTGETYAADALNRDLVTQLLTTFQRQHKRLMRQRMMVVAEAQGHYDYDERGGKRFVRNEEVLVVDEDGSKRVEERPKLLVPDVNFASMNMRDDEVTRQFYEALRASGVPISMRTRLLNVAVDLDDEVEITREEQVRLAVEAQETRRETYRALKAKGLPIPPDLRKDFDPRPVNASEISDAQAQQALMEQGGLGARVPQLGVDDDPAVALAPTMDALAMPPGVPTQLPEGVAGEPDPAGLVRLPRNQARPPESDEMRAGMPVAASVTPVGPDEGADDPRVVLDDKGNRVRVGGTLIDGPWHVGRRATALNEEAV